jgi:hypothetical protein
MQQLIIGILFVVSIPLNMFRASFCPSSGTYQLQQQQLLVYSRNEVVAVLLAVLPPRSYGKPEAAAAVDRLLIMGIRMPETC